MIFEKELPSVEALRARYRLSDNLAERRRQRIKEIENILSGKDKRKIMIVGPCSADREDAVIDYVGRLAKLQEKLVGQLVIVPRVYTSKPRTNGLGYKGLMHRPKQATEADDILAGVIAVRKMHLRVIEETGMFCADEVLYPESVYYILDLLAYATVGARSVEDQGHRQLASGLGIPTGMKNPMCGYLQTLVNSLLAAQHAHSMMYRGWAVRTEGNPFAHAILRGYNDSAGVSHPNYHYETLCQFHDLCEKNNIKNMSLIIDCNHGNSGKRYDEQQRIALEVMGTCRTSPALGNFVKGLMIESYIMDGKQLVGGGEYGKSITDACLGWDKTKRLLEELAAGLNFE